MHVDRDSRYSVYIYVSISFIWLTRDSSISLSYATQIFPPIWMEKSLSRGSLIWAQENGRVNWRNMDWNWSLWILRNEMSSFPFFISSTFYLSHFLENHSLCLSMLLPDPSFFTWTQRSKREWMKIRRRKTRITIGLLPFSPLWFILHLVILAIFQVLCKRNEWNASRCEMEGWMEQE